VRVEGFLHLHQLALLGLSRLQVVLSLEAVSHISLGDVALGDQRTSEGPLELGHGLSEAGFGFFSLLLRRESTPGKGRPDDDLILVESVELVVI